MQSQAPSQTEHSSALASPRETPWLSTLVALAQADPHGYHVLLRQSAQRDLVPLAEALKDTADRFWLIDAAHLRWYPGFRFSQSPDVRREHVCQHGDVVPMSCGRCDQECAHNNWGIDEMARSCFQGVVHGRYGRYPYTGARWERLRGRTQAGEVGGCV